MTFKEFEDKFGKFNDLTNEELKDIADGLYEIIKKRKQWEKTDAFNKFCTAFSKCKDLGMSIYLNDYEYGDVFITSVEDLNYD